MEEPIEVRYAFVMLLAICDPTGHVIGTDVAIARRINMPLADFQRCLGTLMEPDEHSNSREEDGRRVVQSDGERGYRVVNYLTYRDMKDEEEKRTYMREYMRKRRETQRSKADVKRCKGGLADVTQAEAEAEAEAVPPEDAPPAALLPKAAKVRAKAKTETDDEWISGLEKMECFRLTVIRDELGLAQSWCAANSRQCTRQFFNRWLLRSVEKVRTISTAGNGRKPANGADPNIHDPNDTEL